MNYMERYTYYGMPDTGKRLTIDELPNQLGDINEMSILTKMMQLIENAAGWNGAGLLLVERNDGMKSGKSFEQEKTPSGFFVNTEKLISEGSPQKKDYKVCYKYDGRENKQGIDGLFDVGNLRLEIIPRGTGKYSVQQHLGPYYTGGVGLFYGGLALIKPKRNILAAGGMAYLYDVGYWEDEQQDEVGLVNSRTAIEKLYNNPEAYHPFNGNFNIIGLWQEEGNDSEEYVPFRGDWLSPMGWGKEDRKTNSLIYAMGSVRPDIYGYSRNSVQV